MGKLKNIIITTMFATMTTVSFASVQKNLNWKTPLIKEYGSIKYYKNAAIQPDKNLDYKVVFKITSDKMKDGVNNKLWHMARLMNLLYAGGVKKDHIHIVGIVAGKATFVVLNDQSYKKRFRTNNPNIDLLKKLTEHGVKIYVCDQALEEHHIDQKKEVSKYIIPSLSGIVDLTTFQLKGYALAP